MKITNMLLTSVMVIVVFGAFSVGMEFGIATLAMFGLFLAQRAIELAKVSWKVTKVLYTATKMIVALTMGTMKMTWATVKSLYDFAAPKTVKVVTSGFNVVRGRFGKVAA